MLKMVVVEPMPRASARVARVRKAGARSSWRAEMSRPFMHGLLLVERLVQQLPVHRARVVVGAAGLVPLGLADLRALLAPALVDRSQAPASARARSADRLAVHDH